MNVCWYVNNWPSNKKYWMFNQSSGNPFTQFSLNLCFSPRATVRLSKTHHEEFLVFIKSFIMNIYVHTLLKEMGPKEKKERKQNVLLNSLSSIFLLINHKSITLQKDLLGKSRILFSKLDSLKNNLITQWKLQLWLKDTLISPEEMYTSDSPSTLTQIAWKMRNSYWRMLIDSYFSGTRTKKKSEIIVATCIFSDLLHVTGATVSIWWPAEWVTRLLQRENIRGKKSETKRISPWITFTHLQNFNYADVNFY